MDKLPDLGLPFFYRVVLPGAVVTATSAPLLTRLLSKLGLAASDQFLALGGIAIFIGFFLSILDDTVYQVFEGRKWWPSWLYDRRTDKWRMHVAELYRKAQSEQGRLYDEYWSELRSFPVDDNNRPTATRPTRMGNILASYEDYPDRRYGMDSVFYWFRLWLLVDKDTREEIDRSWIEGDAMLYIAFASAWLAVVYVVVALLNYALPRYSAHWFLGAALIAFDQSVWPFDSFGAVSPLLGASGLLLLVAVCVRISGPLMVKNGENFKSLFDVYRSSLGVLQEASACERERWETLSDRLQYGWPRPITSNGPAKPGWLRRLWRRISPL